ncbi:hypothetical protein TREAZ_1059 [Leadbettera azotonutricia ZAS-9]|uniref:Uncharacterized protein n=1 Tax=Leadbettera azotonutricia (strain ATCC BAA-888 / DSM 13862 / ZAS-9) TaxID=545695 RepID=F5Y7L9_LEAAZ|nr:hypothetical protein TREAZ_1059 [Leadbettera azotonutricia ZAS-9]
MDRLTNGTNTARQGAMPTKRVLAEKAAHEWPGALTNKTAAVIPLHC